MGKFSLLPSSRVLQFIRMNDDAGRSAFNFIALIDVEGDGNAVPCYVKVYPKQSERPPIQADMSLFNECIGYLFASCCKYNVPDHAGVIMVDSRFLPDKPKWWIHDTWPCFFSSQISYPTLISQYMQIPNLSSIKKVAELKGLPSVIAFDDVIVNHDRNFGNLLIDHNGSIFLIDHGRILGANHQYWTASSFSGTSIIHTRNVIREALEKLSDSKMNDPVFVNQIYVCHQKIERSLLAENCMHEVRNKMLDFLSEDRVDAVCKLIAARCCLKDASQKLCVLDLR